MSENFGVFAVTTTPSEIEVVRRSVILREPINSSTIKSLGWKSHTHLEGIMEVEFWSNSHNLGAVWRYWPIPLEVYQTIRAHRSTGSIFARIKGAIENQLKMRA
jgi:hypothetical protein